MKKMIFIVAVVATLLCMPQAAYAQDEPGFFDRLFGASNRAKITTGADTEAARLEADAQVRIVEAQELARQKIASERASADLEVARIQADAALSEKQKAEAVARINADADVEAERLKQYALRDIAEFEAQSLVLVAREGTEQTQINADMALALAQENKAMVWVFFIGLGSLLILVFILATGEKVVEAALPPKVLPMPENAGLLPAPNVILISDPEQARKLLEGISHGQ